jgi:hypothetical protein
MLGWKFVNAQLTQAAIRGKRISVLCWSGDTGRGVGLTDGKTYVAIRVHCCSACSEEELCSGRYGLVFFFHRGWLFL